MANLPIKLIDQMNQIFFWQVKIGKEIKPGDRLNITYQAFYINDKRVKIGDILAVSYRHPNGTSYEAIRHVSRNGDIAYYHPNGSSLKKAFNRYPIRFSHISSSFGSSRKHPILHYHRPHKGIDLAAPIGTPIYSIGEGRIAFIGRQNGYGNMIKIIHDRQYTTVYAHMLKFQKGLHKGSNIKKGQVIGFVGQSGLATGPHCHYELHVNRIPRNPTTVALPQAMPIPKHEAFAFNRRARELIAQLKLYEDSQLATARSPGKNVLG
jgi:murein DD-endopeptidase MepM/ murein hydrolase activator NlpD